jgi:hypothetical protein
MMVPAQTVIPATMVSPQPLLADGRPGEGPSSVTSAGAQPGPVRNLTVNEPPCPLTE